MRRARGEGEKEDALVSRKRLRELGEPRVARPVEVADVDDEAAECCAVTADPFGRRVQDDVGPLQGEKGVSMERGGGRVGRVGREELEGWGGRGEGEGRREAEEQPRWKEEEEGQERGEREDAPSQPAG